MFKKLLKISLILIMILGGVISFLNMLSPELQSTPIKWVTYYKDVPDCSGPKGTCADMTQPKPVYE